MRWVLAAVAALVVAVTLALALSVGGESERPARTAPMPPAATFTPGEGHSRGHEEAP